MVVPSHQPLYLFFPIWDIKLVPIQGRSNSALLPQGRNVLHHAVLRDDAETVHFRGKSVLINGGNPNKVVPQFVNAFSWCVYKSNFTMICG